MNGQAGSTTKQRLATPLERPVAALHSLEALPQSSSAEALQLARF